MNNTNLKYMKLKEIKEKLEKRELAAKLKRENYKKLNYPITCPYCKRDTTLNIFNMHQKTKHCIKIKDLINEDLTKDKIKYANNLIFLDKVKKILLSNDNDDEKDKNIIELTNSIFQKTQETNII